MLGGVSYPHEAADAPAPAGLGKGAASEPIVGNSPRPTLHPQGPDHVTSDHEMLATDNPAILAAHGAQAMSPNLQPTNRETIVSPDQPDAQLVNASASEPTGFIVRVCLTEQEAISFLALYRQLPKILDVHSLLDAHRPLCAVAMALKGQHPAHFHALDQRAQKHPTIKIER